MGQAKRRRQAFFANHPTCYFCASEPAATIEHMPPRIAFPSGLHPEGYEFPACERCNNGQSALEQVVALYIHAFDYDSANLDRAHLNKLIRGVHNNNPDMLPIIGLSTREKRRYLQENEIKLADGAAISELPLARVPGGTQRAFHHFMRKLTCALFYRVAGHPLPLDHVVR